MIYPIHVSHEPIEGDLIGDIALALCDALNEIDEGTDSEDFEAVFRKFASTLIRRLEPSGIVFIRVTSTPQESH